MNQFIQNISNIYGEKGKAWLQELPAVLSELCKCWQLKDLVPVENKTYHYVALATTKDQQAVVLKIGCDKSTIVNEKKALSYFDGVGAVKLLDYNSEFHALLLQQAIPGKTLTEINQHHPKTVINRYVEVMKKLHSRSLIDDRFPHISEWLQTLERCQSQKIPPHILQKAIGIKNELLFNPSKEKILHGDLHHDNILQHGDQWLAIDPKGVIGEAEFEMAAFDFMYVSHFSKCNDVKNIFIERSEQLAEAAQLDANKIFSWIFVRLVLMAVWAIEDNQDPENAMNLAVKIA